MTTCGHLLYPTLWSNNTRSALEFPLTLLITLDSSECSSQSVSLAFPLSSCAHRSVILIGNSSAFSISNSPNSQLGCALSQPTSGRLNECAKSSVPVLVAIFRIQSIQQCAIGCHREYLGVPTLCGFSTPSSDQLASLLHWWNLPASLIPIPPVHLGVRSPNILLCRLLPPLPSSTKSSHVFQGIFTERELEQREPPRRDPPRILHSGIP